MPAARQCPSCGSQLLHPLDWNQHPELGATLTMRCPECELRWCLRVPERALRELDRSLAVGRRELRDAYAALRRTSPADLAGRLIGPLGRGVVDAGGRGPGEGAPLL